MKSRFTILCLAFFQVANSQYYTVPACSYNYYASSAPTYAPATPNLQPKSLPSPPKTPKCNVGSTSKSSVKCFPQTASAYFLTTPLEKVKANVLTKEKTNDAKSPTPYSCDLCNNFANVQPNSKVPPPPPIGSPVLPGIIDKVPTIAIPKEISTKDEGSILKPKSLFTDMYAKNKIPKKLSFDQDLLEGFLTGLGIAL